MELIKPAPTSEKEPPFFELSFQPFLRYLTDKRKSTQSEELSEFYSYLVNRLEAALPVPREESLFGDDFTYEYRGAKLKAEPWPDFLLEARDRIETLCGLEFNFVVGNRYLTGKDSIGWHSDNFPQIGKRPAIASLSLGSTRRFKLRHKETGEVVDYDLESGSLLIMLPGCQEDWEHAVPKTARPVGERINWTFRPHVDARR